MSPHRARLCSYFGTQREHRRGRAADGTSWNISALDCEVATIGINLAPRPDASRVLATIEHYLGRPVDASASEPLRVDATLERVPAQGWRLRLATGALWKRARLEATGEFWFDKSRALDSRPDAGGEFRVWSLGLRTCGVPSVSRVEFPLCGGVEVGAMTGVGTGISDPETERLAWVVASGEAMVIHAPWRHVALWFGARLRIPLARPSFAIEGLGTVHAVAPVGADAAFGVELRLVVHVDDQAIPALRLDQGPRDSRR